MGCLRLGFKSPKKEEAKLPMFNRHKFEVSVDQLTRLLGAARKAYHEVCRNTEVKDWAAWYARYISHAVRFESDELFDPGSTSNIIEESGEVHPAFELPEHGPFVPEQEWTPVQQEPSGYDENLGRTDLDDKTGAPDR